MMFILWSSRMNAWVSEGGTGTSEIAQAKRFGRTAAIERARAALSYEGTPVLIPVSLDLIEEVKAKS